MMSQVSNGSSTDPDVGSMEASRLDAGMRSLDHYKIRLPKLHYNIRQLLIPFIRAETPYLATLQHNCRSPSLDTYFSNVAILGTHTFYMAFLPLLFWTGHIAIGRAMVHILAAGVFFTGVLKDMLCLPRPLSPPLLRISKSHSAALEYGFPSTHSANAISVAAYAMYALRTSADKFPADVLSIMQRLSYLYVTSIVLGRLYCGMHGFLDVVVGCILGALIAATQIIWGNAFDAWLGSGSIHAVFMFAAVLMAAIRLHPEPADDCPCFDDSVAFCGTVLGVDFGFWRIARLRSIQYHLLSTTLPFELTIPAWSKPIVRIASGLVLIFAWRALAKPTLLKGLPPLFRIIETSGFLLPRRFFLNASQYKVVPKLRRDENLIPQASDIPAFLSYIRHPRKRTVSIGPQSEADAREVIANREHRRRQSMSSGSDYTKASPMKIDLNGVGPTKNLSTSSGAQYKYVNEVAVATPASETLPDLLLTNPEGAEIRENEQEKKLDDAMFLQLQKPRVRYDVEVITKLIVYSGIGWISIELCPRLWESCGIGIDSYFI